MRNPRRAYVTTAHLMASRFSAIVQQTGALTEEDMRRAIRAARKEGVSIPNFSSRRSLQILNAIYVEGGE